MGSLEEPSTAIAWHAGALDIAIHVSAESTPHVAHVTPHGQALAPLGSRFFASTSLPLDDGVRALGEGHNSIKTAKSLIGSYLSRRLQYVRHHAWRADGAHMLDVISEESSSGLRITHHFVVYDDIPVLRSSATASNASAALLHLTQLSSLVLGGMTTKSRAWWEDYTLATATNSWFREAQWAESTLSNAGLDDCGLFELHEGHEASQACLTFRNRGSFSTGTHLPMGMLKKTDATDTWLWQIEHNGSWRWEIGDFHDSIYLAAGGPTRTDHDWSLDLGPGESFTTPWVACCHVFAAADAAFSAMTQYRRRIRRQHQDYDGMPIIFNDYMNCLMGDPTEEKIKALLPPVSRTGAEYFVIDAGWYADDSSWWDDVGLWEPSKKRFPSGFKTLMDTIRAHNLIPGVWLEPEVVGVRSAVGKQLPDEAFFLERGRRVIERGRFQLDYRHPAVRQRMHAVVDRLVTEYGIGYFKFDYNIEVLTGSDVDTTSTGAAHLEHQRAYLNWVSELLDKYSSLVIENCSSGAQRMDYAMLAIHTLQSTSDQQDPALYAAIAAAVPTAVVPEQSATWSYPQREWSDETNALTIVNSLLGRVHLSGQLDHLQEHQFSLVVEGMSVYAGIRHELKHSSPFWPLGLPKWHDDWIALGLLLERGDMLLSIWRRGGPTAFDLNLPLDDSNPSWQSCLLFPTTLPTTHVLRGRSLHVELPSTTCARLLRITLQK